MYSGYFEDSAERIQVLFRLMKREIKNDFQVSGLVYVNSSHVMDSLLAIGVCFEL